MTTREEQAMIELRKVCGIKNEFVMPYGCTQDGIADALGIKRSHASIVMKKLEEKGYVGHIKAHPDGIKAKRMCYFLTVSGIRRCNELMEGEVM